jgi:hypothetical protein
MTSDAHNYRPYGARGGHRDHVSPTEGGYRNRYASARLAEQQVEAAMRELRELFELAEKNTRDRKAAGDAIRLAWKILCFYGFSDFDEIKNVRTEEWPSLIDTQQHALVSLSLEIVGWYQFGLRPYDIDRTARIFDRALELTPQNQRALERFAIVANTIQPEHIGGLAKFPKKQQETALGYRLQCKRKIDDILMDVFGITEAHLVGQAEQSVTELLQSRSNKERRFVFEILGHLSRMNSIVGDFFGNGTQVSLGTGAACCQLEMLGLPRDVGNLLKLLESRLEEGHETEVAGEETQKVCDILETVADMFECKWRLFKNNSAQNRAQEIRDFLVKVGIGCQRSAF